MELNYFANVFLVIFLILLILIFIIGFKIKVLLEDPAELKMPEVKIITEEGHKPYRSTVDAAGYDLKIHNFKKAFGPKGPTDFTGRGTKTLILLPGDRVLVGTGVRMAIPSGFEFQIRSRSGQAINKGLAVLNSPGTIDADYRGEIGVILINLGYENIHLQIGDKICQGVFAKVGAPEFKDVEVFPLITDNERGERGFGSTGTR